MRTVLTGLLVLALLAPRAGAQLDAAFSVDATVGTNPASFQFTNLSSGGTIIASQWDFGDGSFSNQNNTSHTYTTPGTYTVSLTVLALGFESDTETQVDLIQVDPAVLVADFGVAPASGTQPLQVQFSDLSVGPVDAWDWEFGDGSGSHQQNPSHTYTPTEATDYDVRLTVWAGGQSTTVLVEDAVHVEPAVLLPGFSVPQAILRSGQTMTLINTSTSSAEDVDYDWDYSPLFSGPFFESPQIVRPYVEVPTWVDLTLTASVGEQQASVTAAPAFGVVPTAFAPALPGVVFPGSISTLQPADVDQDGDVDVVGATTGQVGWMANDGQGALGPFVPLAIGLPTAPRVTVADLSGDGAPDVVLYNPNGLAEIRFNDGAGGFGPAVHVPALSGWTTDVAALDLDGDGDLDLAALQTLLGGGPPLRVALLENLDQAGGFALVAQNTQIDTYHLDVFDGDGDGDPDLMLDRGWLRNQHPVWIHHPNDWWKVGGDVGDLDNDGDLDALGGFGELLWVRNIGQATLPSVSVVPSFASAEDAQRVQLADRDLDGDLDAFGVEAQGTLNWGWLANPGSDGVPWIWHAERTGIAPSTALADLDGDGDMDLVHDQGAQSGVEEAIVRLNAWTGPTWVETGPALASPTGRPGLLANGSLSGGTVFGLTIDQASPGGSVILVVGASALDAPFKGGVLGPHPLVLVPVGSMDADGVLPLMFDWPNGLAAGTDVWLQAWIQDPQMPAGYSATRTLRTTTL